MTDLDGKRKATRRDSWRGRPQRMPTRGRHGARKDLTRSSDDSFDCPRELFVSPNGNR
jgi:hypothetical protein